MDPGPSRLSAVVGVGGSLLFHAAVGVWLAFAPPPTTTLAARPGAGSEGFELTLTPPPDPAATPQDTSKADPVKPPEESPKPPESATAPPPPPPPPPKPEATQIDADKIKMGIDESPAPPETKTFLGSDKPTEHQAPSSSVEQPALTPEPGKAGSSGSGSSPTEAVPTDKPPKPETPMKDPAPAATPTEAPAPAETTPPPAPAEAPAPSEAPAAPAEAPATPAAPGPLTPPMPEGPATPAAPNAEPSDREPTPQVEPSDVRSGDNREKAAALLEEFLGQWPVVVPGSGLIYIPPRPAMGPTTAPPAGAPAAAPSAPAVTSTPPAPAGAPGGEKNRPGEKSVKESSAFTVKKTLEYKPGKPLAAEGIEVTTVDPDISMLSAVTGSVRNPVILLRFGPDGRVRTAEFKDGLDTGRKDWNDPIMHAMHRWTLGGKKFQELIAESPSREIVMSVRLLLR